MHPRQPGKRHGLLVLAALVATLLVGVGVLQYVQWNRVQSTLSEGKASVQWDIFQFQAEHLKLAAKIDEILRTRGNDDAMAQLVLRHNVYLSRYDIMRSGIGPRQVFFDPQYQSTFAAFASYIDKAQAYLGDEDTVPLYNEASLLALRQALAEAAEPLQAMVLAMNAAHNETSTQHLKALREQAVISGATSVALALVAIAFGLVALHQLNLSQRRNATLEDLHRQLEKALEQAERASLSKGQFLANMSHEIRTPMNAILGMLKLLGNTNLTANQFDYLSKSESAAKSLLGLLNDILDFSKIDAGKMELDLQPFKVDDLMRHLAVVLSANVGNKDIEVLYDIDPEVPEQLLGDAMRLQQVLINLAGNAVKFTRSGQVVIRLACTPGDAPRAAQTAITFSVTDSGIGIAPENQAKIFSGFSQAEASTTRRFGGTGLGLAISKRLVEMMGGQLGLNSTLGVGSEFHFRLQFPLVVQPETGDAPDAAIGPTRVLVIDDNPKAGALLVKMMGTLGWQADLAEGAVQAIAWVQKQSKDGALPYQYLFVDWQMPQMDGWATIGQLQHLHAELATPMPKVIMLSANSRENLSHRTQAEQDLLHAFLVKPVTASMLFDAAQSHPAHTESLRRLPRSSLRQLAGMRILVVEDNAINQQVAEELLHSEGAVVSIAADGRQGVNAIALAKQPFDVVLMDVQMPVMDGFEATRSIREELGLTNLPIIGLTANAMASDREACLQAGMNDHMGKPFDLALLVSTLIKITGFRAAALPAELAHEPQDTVQETPATSPHGPALVNADIDVPTALQRMAGMQDLYVRASHEFLTPLASLADEVSQRLQDGEWSQARALLHTSKGNAGTLGLHRLAEELARLERLCHGESHPPTVPRVDALASIVQSAQLALGQAIALLTPPVNPDSAAQPAHTPVQYKLHLQQLITLLEADDLGALELYASIRDSLQQLPDSQRDQLETALQDLDLPVALQVCQSALNGNDAATTV